MASLHPYTTRLYTSTDGTLGIGTSFTEIALCKLVTPPDLDTGESNTTVLNSTGKTEENQPGWNKVGEMPIEIRFTQATYDILAAFKSAGTILTFKIQYPLASGQVTAFKQTFAAWVKKLAITDANAEDDNTFTIKLGLRLTGPITTTDGA